MKPYFEDTKAGIVIYHGDCREIIPTLENIDLIIADPPYGVNCNTKTASSGRVGDKSKIKGCAPRLKDHLAVHGDDKTFDPSHLLRLKVPTVLWGANHYANTLPNSPTWLIWDKRDGTGSDDNADCEMAWSNLGGPARLYRQLWRGLCISGQENGRSRLHPNQKPVSLMLWCINKSKNATLILDPYMGSGTTLRAAKDLGIKCIGIEIEEQYCEIGARRLNQEVLAL